METPVAVHNHSCVPTHTPALLLSPIDYGRSETTINAGNKVGN